MERSGPLAGAIGVCNDHYKGFDCFSLRCQDGLVEAIIQTDDLNTSIMLRIDDKIYPIEVEPETEDTRKLRLMLKQELTIFHVPDHMFDAIKSSRRLEWSQVVYGSALDFRKIDVPGEDSPDHRVMVPFEKACSSQSVQKKPTETKIPASTVTKSRFKPLQPKEHIVLRGWCNMGQCSWSRWLSTTVESNQNDEVSLTIKLLGGSSEFEGRSNKNISWNKASHNVSVTCSYRRPAVLIGGQEQALLLNPYDRPPSVLASAENLYYAACHSDTTEGSSRAKKYGYNVVVR